MGRFQNIRFLVGSFIVFAAATIAAPAAFACGPHENGEGHQRHHHHDGEDNNGSENDGPRHGHHGRHGDVDVGVGVYDPPGYGHGRIGPPTEACAELHRMRVDLGRLFTIRAQVVAGSAVVYTRDGSLRVMHGVTNYRERNRDHAVVEGLLDPDPTYGMRQNEQAYDALRDSSLERLDGRISATQDRIGQLEYECHD